MGELIPIMIFAIPLAAIIMGSRNKRLEMELEHRRNSGGDTNVSAMQTEIRDLKERIAVLERIVTENDGAASLNREIEKLR